MARGDRLLEHVLRRIGFGASAADLARYSGLSPAAVIDQLLNYEQAPNNVDDNIGKPEFVSVTSNGRFAPNTVINDARQRELFRMVHSQRPLQEKMALFWHHHFATAYQKVADTYGGTIATRMLAGSEIYNAPKGSPAGQIELFRRHALGNFYESMLKEMRDAAGDSGEVYAPRSVVRFMVDVIDPKSGEMVLDPACGTGGFLVEAYSHMEKQCKTVQQRRQLQQGTILGN